MVKMILSSPEKDRLLNMCNNMGETALFQAASKGNQDTVVQLVQHGADVNLANQFNESPLYIATYGGHLPVVQSLLLAPNIRINMKNQDGATAASVAQSRGLKEIQEAIVARQQQLTAAKIVSKCN